MPVAEEIKKSKSVPEVIMVDDGSDKKSKEVLNGVGGVRLITHEKNIGKSAAMKTGCFSRNTKLEKDLYGVN